MPLSLSFRLQETRTPFAETTLSTVRQCLQTSSRSTLAHLQSAWNGVTSPIPAARWWAVYGLSGSESVPSTTCTIEVWTVCLDQTQRTVRSTVWVVVRGIKCGWLRRMGTVWTLAANRLSQHLVRDGFRSNNKREQHFIAPYTWSFLINLKKITTPCSTEYRNCWLNYEFLSGMLENSYDVCHTGLF